MVFIQKSWRPAVLTFQFQANDECDDILEWGKGSVGAVVVVVVVCVLASSRLFLACGRASGWLVCLGGCFCF